MKTTVIFESPGSHCALNALTLLAGQQKGHLVCKN